MRRLGVCRALTAVSLLLPALGLALATPAEASADVAHIADVAHATTAQAPTAPSVEEPLEITLAGVSPTIAQPGQSLTLAGTVRNRGTAAVARPLVRVVLGSQPLTGRRAVARWAEATGPAQGREVGRQQLPAALAPGGAAAFRVEVKRAANLRDPAYGALPLSIEVGGTSLRTFAGYQRQKEYQPLRLGWLVPLTLDPNPALFGPAGTARDQAWSQALGAGSRLARVVESSESAPVTWAIDPTLLPSLLPKDTGEPGAGGEPADSKSTEVSARQAMEDRIRSVAGQHTPWVLPDVDADVAAVADSGKPSALASTLVSRAAPVAAALGARGDIAWPADGRHTAARERALGRLYVRPRLAAQVAAQSSLPLDDNTQDAHRRSSDGLPVLAYDDQLSALLGQTDNPASAALATQRFVAESVALLDERPGTSSRSVLVAASRSFNPDPAAASAFFQTAALIPWLEPVTTAALLADAAHAVPMPKEVGTRPTPQPSEAPAPQDPYATSRPVLNARRLTFLENGLRTVHGVAQIREDGEGFRRTWGRATEQLVSTRWRTSPSSWSTLGRQITAATRETTSAIKVSKRNVNFLADTGRLQVTVTNDLDVAVENVKLTLEPANPRLRIDSQPPLLRIGAKSRTTATVDVTTLAAGLVPIRTTLTTPDGTVIGEGVDVQVQVTPTGDWVYWTLGGVAGIILVLGIWRSVRRKPTPRNAADPSPSTLGTA